jgi:hypothetical protein
VLIKKCGGSVKKAMNGKPSFSAAIRARAAHIVVTKKDYLLRLHVVGHIKPE